MDLKGANLASFKKAEGKHFNELIALNILQQILQAIKYIHEAGLIHRDLKPVRKLNFTNITV